MQFEQQIAYQNNADQISTVQQMNSSSHQHHNTNQFMQAALEADQRRFAKYNNGSTTAATALTSTSINNNMNNQNAHQHQKTSQRTQKSEGIIHHQQTSHQQPVKSLDQAKSILNQVLNDISRDRLATQDESLSSIQQQPPQHQQFQQQNAHFMQQNVSNLQYENQVRQADLMPLQQTQSKQAQHISAGLRHNGYQYHKDSNIENRHHNMPLQQQNQHQYHPSQKQSSQQNFYTGASDQEGRSSIQTTTNGGYKPVQNRQQDSQHQFFESLGLPADLNNLQVQGQVGGSKSSIQQRDQQQMMMSGAGQEADVVPQKIIQQNHAPSREILTLTIEIGEGHNENILIREGDNPYVLAANFAEKHRIGEQLRDLLAEQIRQNIEQVSLETNQNSSIQQSQNDRFDEQTPIDYSQHHSQHPEYTSSHQQNDVVLSSYKPHQLQNAAPSNNSGQKKQKGQYYANHQLSHQNSSHQQNHPSTHQSQSRQQFIEANEALVYAERLEGQIMEGYGVGMGHQLNPQTLGAGNGATDPSQVNSVGVVGGEVLGQTDQNDALGYGTFQPGRQYIGGGGGAGAGQAQFEQNQLVSPSNGAGLIVANQEGREEDPQNFVDQQNGNGYPNVPFSENYKSWQAEVDNRLRNGGGSQASMQDRPQISHGSRKIMKQKQNLAQSQGNAYFKDPVHERLHKAAVTRQQNKIRSQSQRERGLDIYNQTSQRSFESAQAQAMQQPQQQFNENHHNYEMLTNNNLRQMHNTVGAVGVGGSAKNPQRRQQRTAKSASRKNRPPMYRQNNSARKASETLNYGEKLYEQGMKRKEERDTLLRQARSELFHRELDAHTFKPRTNSRGSLREHPTEDLLINYGKRKEQTLEHQRALKLEKEMSECNFRPQISKKSDLMVRNRSMLVENQSGRSEQSRKSQHNKFQNLYEDAVRRNERQVNIYSACVDAECTFQPDIEKSKFAARRRFSSASRQQDRNSEANLFERLSQGGGNGGAGVPSGNLGAAMNSSRERSLMCLANSRTLTNDLYDPETGQELFKPRVGRGPRTQARPNPGTTKTHQMLYQAAQGQMMKKISRQVEAEVKRNMEANRKFSSTATQKIMIRKKIASFNQIFTWLDSDRDNQISAEKIDITILPAELLEVLSPLFVEMEDLGQSLDAEEFVDAVGRLYESVTPPERDILLLKDQQRDRSVSSRKGMSHSESQKHQPKINAKSRKIAEKRNQGLDVSQRLYRRPRRQSEEEFCLQAHQSDISSTKNGANTHQSASQQPHNSKLFYLNTNGNGVNNDNNNFHAAEIASDSEKCAKSSFALAEASRRNVVQNHQQPLSANVNQEQGVVPQSATTEDIVGQMQMFNSMQLNAANQVASSQITSQGLPQSANIASNRQEDQEKGSFVPNSQQQFQSYHQTTANGLANQPHLQNQQVENQEQSQANQEQAVDLNNLAHLIATEMLQKHLGNQQSSAGIGPQPQNQTDSLNELDSNFVGAEEQQFHESNSNNFPLQINNGSQATNFVKMPLPQNQFLAQAAKRSSTNQFN